MSLHSRNAVSAPTVEHSETTDSSNSSTPPGIDPRGPRVSAALSASLLLAVVVLSLLGAELAALTGLAAVAVLFAWGAFAGIRRHPYSVLFARFVRPRLTVQTEWENPKPPTFAQGVGLVVTGIGIVLGILGLPIAVTVAASAAFLAAFLNAAYGYCLGCQIYVLLIRLRS